MWQNGDPVSFQLGKHEAHLPLTVYFYFNRPSNIKKSDKEITVPDKINTTGILNANQMKCRSTMMLLDNLAAKPEWILVGCHEPRPCDVLCIVENTSQISYNFIPNKSNLKIYDKSCVLVNGTCYQFIRNSYRNLTSKINENMPGPNSLIAKFDHIFKMIGWMDFSVFSWDLKFNINYNIYSNIYRYSITKIKDNSTEGIYILSHFHPYTFITGGNIFECQSQVLISSIFVCDDKIDCPGDMLSDEFGCDCKDSHKNTICKHITRNTSRATCSIFYSEAKDGSCQIYRNRQLENDEYIIKLSMNDTYSTGQLKCKEGQEKYYDFSDICVYKLTYLNILIPCSDGAHIQECNKFECNMQYKCPGYYCIPWSYVCDGKWDCPHGLDELKKYCKETKHCPNMFKCRNSSICIHVGNVCDNQNNCPLDDDEYLCSLQDVICPDMCDCLTFTVRCLGVAIEHISESKLPYYIVQIQYSSRSFTKAFLKQLNVIVELSLLFNGLYDICSFLPLLDNTIKLDLGFNEIRNLVKECFVNSIKLKTLKLNNNKISIIIKDFFKSFFSLTYLDVSNNLLSNFELCFLQLNTLAINNNPLLEISQHAFSRLKASTILTNDYHICCVTPAESVCIAKRPWYKTCFNLLNSFYVKYSTSIISLFIILANLGSILLIVYKNRESETLNKNKKSNSFQVIGKAIHLNDVTCGLCLLALFGSDLNYSEGFVLKEVEWRSGIVCVFIFGTFLQFNVMSPLLLGLLCLTRLMVVVYPLDTKFKEMNFVRKLIGITFISTSISTITATTVIWNLYSEIPFKLCSPFIDVTGSITLMHINTWIVVALQVVSTIFILICYSLVILNLRKSQRKIEKQTTSSQYNVPLIIQIVTISTSNILCWIPGGIIFLISSYMERYPLEMVTWTIVAVASINSIIDPIIIIATTIRK